MEPVSTTVIVAGGWLAAKVFGPSADEMGGQLKAYVGARLNSVFRKAEAKVDPSNIRSVSPGFALNFVQKVSASDESDIVTDMWASLLADASTSQSYKHNVFADVLARIGPNEANFMKSLLINRSVEELIKIENDDLRRFVLEEYQEIFDWSKHDQEDAQDRANELFNFRTKWPTRTRSASWPFLNEGRLSYVNLSMVSESDWNGFNADILMRERLIEHFKFSLGVSWETPGIEGFMLTRFGFEFLRTCERPDIQ